MDPYSSYLVLDEEEDVTGRNIYLFRSDDESIKNIINSRYAVETNLPEFIVDYDSCYEDLEFSKESIHTKDVHIIKSNSRYMTVSDGANTKEETPHALNQEKYLRVFLEDGEVPMDNNASERAIRGFCIGKKNWEMIDTINGATSSAIIYSIAETAKANNLKPYEYFEYLLTQIPAHTEVTK